MQLFKIQDPHHQNLTKLQYFSRTQKRANSQKSKKKSPPHSTQHTSMVELEYCGGEVYI